MIEHDQAMQRLDNYFAIRREFFQGMKNETARINALADLDCEMIAMEKMIDNLFPPIKT